MLLNFVVLMGMLNIRQSTALGAREESGRILLSLSENCKISPSKIFSHPRTTALVLKRPPSVFAAKCKPLNFLTIFLPIVSKCG